VIVTSTYEGIEQMNYFPVFLACADRTVVVFGGGADALAKLKLLILPAKRSNICNAAGWHV